MLLFRTKDTLMSGNEVSLTQAESQEFDQAMHDIAGQLAPSSQRIYRSDARHFATWLLARGITPTQMTRSNMIAYRSYLSESTYSKATKQRMFAVACRIMNEQYINGTLAVKVTTEVKGFRTESDETTHTALSKSEAREMLSRVDTSTKQGKRDYAILLTLLKTGLRRSELVALNRGNLKWMDGHHVAIVEHGKGDKKRVVKLRVDVWRSLEAYVAILPAATDATQVFVSFRRGDHPTTRRMTDKSIELVVTRYAPEGSGLTPHGMRATFATLALEEKAPLHQVQYAMGHKDPRTTERYQRRKLNLDDNAVDVLNF
jgi:integrase/recombinase XerD